MTDDDLIRHFVCPECGSEEWGTSGLLGPFNEWKGHCHGQGCTYTWLRGDDALCFQIIDVAKEEAWEDTPWGNDDREEDFEC